MMIFKCPLCDSVDTEMVDAGLDYEIYHCNGHHGHVQILGHACDCEEKNGIFQEEK